MSSCRKSYETNHHHYHHKEKRPGRRHHRNHRNTSTQYTRYRWRLRRLRRPHHLRPHHRRFRPRHRPGFAERIAASATPANLSPPPRSLSHTRPYSLFNYWAIYSHPLPEPQTAAGNMAARDTGRAGRAEAEDGTYFMFLKRKSG